MARATDKSPLRIPHAAVRGAVAVIFPGQGSQTDEMREQVERHRPDLLELALSEVGAELFERASDGTRWAQPAIFCAALAGWEQLRERVEPAFMAGHSLGEISALTAAGAIRAEDGLRLVAARGRLMQEAAEQDVTTVRMPRKYPDAVPRMNISERQQKVLITVLESGEVGPSTVADRLEISVSTAYRDLSVLEEHGLVAGAESGKREITPLGHDLIETIVDSWVK